MYFEYLGVRNLKLDLGFRNGVTDDTFGYLEPINDLLFPE